MLLNEKLKFLFTAFIGSILFVLVKGYSYGAGNMPCFLPNIMHALAPSLFIVDDYFSSMSSYHPLFQSLCVFFAGIFGLHQGLFVIYCISAVVIVSAVISIVKLLCPERVRLAVLSGLLLWHIGGVEATELAVKPITEASLLGNGLVLWGMFFCLRGRLLPAFIIAGLISFVHLPLSLSFFAILVVVYFWRKSADRDFSWKNLFLLSLIFFLLAGFPLSITAKHLAAQQSTLDFPFFSYLKFRVPHHFFVFLWRGTALKFLLLFFCGVYSFLHYKSERSVKKMLAICLAIIFGCVIQFMFIDIVSVEALAKIHFYRMGIFISFFALVLSLRFMAEKVLTFKETGLKVMALTYFVSVTPYIGVPVFWGCVLFSRLPLKRGLSLIVCVCYFFFWGGHLSGGSGFVGGRWPFYLLMLLGASLLVWIIIRISRVSQRLLLSVPLLLVLVFIVPDNVKGINIFPSYRGGFMDVCRWAEENTDKKALFAVPPWQQGFAVFSKRTQFVSFKNAPYTSAGIGEWVRRMNVILGDDDILKWDKRGFRAFPHIKKRYNGLPDETRMSLAKKENIDYMIMDASVQTSLPVIYSNDSYQVCSLNQESS